MHIYLIPTFLGGQSLEVLLARHNEAPLSPSLEVPLPHALRRRAEEIAIGPVLTLMSYRILPNRSSLP